MLSDLINVLNFAGQSEAFNFTREEKVIGTWVDGKPLYQKVLTGNLGTVTAVAITSAPAQVLWVIDSTIQIHKIFGNLKYYTSSNQYGFVYFPGGLYSTTATNFTNALCCLVVDNKLTAFVSGAHFSNQPYEVVVQYTKTTD